MLQSKEHIGKLDRRITFIQKVTVTGDSNEDKLTGWEEIEYYPDVWAGKKDMPGRELSLGDRVTYVQPTHFLIRSRDDIDEKMRIVCDTRVYEIISMNELGRGNYFNVVTNLLDNIYYT